MDDGGGVFRALDAEWRRVGTGRAAAARLEEWARREPVLGGFVLPSELVARCHSRDDQCFANAVLRALLRLGASDGLAARTVLQAVLPGLVGVARRARAASPCSRACRDQEVVATAWEQITALSASPPAWPAMAIVGATWSRLRTQLGRERRWRDGTEPMGDREEPPAVLAGPSSGEVLLGVLAESVRRGAINRDASQVIARTRVLGSSPEDVARASGRTVAAVYKLRQRAELSLVSLGEELSDAS
jgi:DNA-directed RNA polymerase specialized sigma24 family protein